MSSEFVTRAELRRRWEADRAALCAQFNLTVGQADEMLYTLPYSSIPDWGDVSRMIELVRRFKADGDDAS